MLDHETYLLPILYFSSRPSDQSGASLACWPFSSRGSSSGGFMLWSGVRGLFDRIALVLFDWFTLCIELRWGAFGPSLLWNRQRLVAAFRHQNLTHSLGLRLRVCHPSLTSATPHLLPYHVRSAVMVTKGLFGVYHIPPTSTLQPFNPSTLHENGPLLPLRVNFMYLLHYRNCYDIVSSDCFLRRWLFPPQLIVREGRTCFFPKKKKETGFDPPTTRWEAQWYGMTIAQ